MCILGIPILSLLIFFPLLGAILLVFIDKEKLVKAMITGKKDIDDTYQ